MKLIDLIVDRFKGIEHFELHIDGENASIFGDNATGKTTVYDAWLWLLFGKDSTDRKDFEVKPLNAFGDVAQHGADTTVTATLEQDDGTRVTLRRVYAEKWERRRGSAEPELMGNTTAYYVDELPVKQTDYKACVDAICPEKTFKLLTGASYFCTVLPWQERRRVLFELAGGVTEDEIFAANPELSELATAKGAHTVENFKKISAARRATLNKELTALPARIDEASRVITQTQAVDTGDAERRLAGLQEERRSLTDTLARSEQVAEVQLKSDIAALKSNLAANENENRLHKVQEKEKTRAQLRAQNQPIHEQIIALKEKAFALRTDRAAYLKEADRCTARCDSLRETYMELRAKEWSGDLVCPTCKRAYAEEDIGAAMAAFDAHKREELDAINAEGKQRKQDAEQAQAEADRIGAELPAVTAQIITLTASLADESNTPDPPDGLAYLATKEQLEEAIRSQEARLSAMTADRAKEMEHIRTQVTEIDRRIRDLQTDIAAADANKRAQNRVAELMDQQQCTAAELENMERMIILCERYTRAMVRLTEDRVDGKFKRVRWKLFDEQINGGLNETCIPTVDGVPYTDLNHAMRVNAGLDVVQTLGRFYGVSAPVFVDNAESVTELMSITAQTIRLVVAEQDKQLRVQLG